MPRYTPQVAKLKAQRVSKSLIDNGLNASEVARLRGTTPQNEAKLARSKPVVDTLQEYLDSPKLKKELENVAVEGLKANSTTRLGVLPNHDARHKFWRDLMIGCGKLKVNGTGTGASVVNIIYGYRRADSPVRS
jgi:hypothetical protein